MCSNLFFRFVKISFFLTYFCVCVQDLYQSLSSAPLNQAPVPVCRETSCVLIVHVCLCSKLYVLESLLRFRFREYWIFPDIFFCVCARSLSKPFFRPSQAGSCAWLSPFLLCADCTCVLVCVYLCTCMWKCVGKLINIQQM